MPIYAYRCPECGHAKDVLQKMSDAAPECPACGKATMQKQLTAAGFQLKGSGWYATDFKGASPAPKEEAACPATGESAGACPACPAAGTAASASTAAAE